MWSRVTRKLNHVLLLGQPDGGHQQERKQGVRYNRHSVNSSVACQNDSRWLRQEGLRKSVHVDTGTCSVGERTPK